MILSHDYSMLSAFHKAFYVFVTLLCEHHQGTLGKYWRWVLLAGCSKLPRLLYT